MACITCLIMPVFTGDKTRFGVLSPTRWILSPSRGWGHQNSLESGIKGGNPESVAGRCFAILPRPSICSLSGWFPVITSVLSGIGSQRDRQAACGLTPNAACCHRFAIPNRALPGASSEPPRCTAQVIGRKQKPCSITLIPLVLVLSETVLVLDPFDRAKRWLRWSRFWGPPKLGCRPKRVVASIGDKPGPP